MFQSIIQLLFSVSLTIFDLNFLSLSWCMEYGLTARLTPNIQTDIYLRCSLLSPLSALSPAPAPWSVTSASQTINISGSDQALP